MPSGLFESREAFLKEFGRTVAPELLPHLWMDVPAPILRRSLPPNILHALLGNTWLSLISIHAFEHKEQQHFATVQTIGGSAFRVPTTKETKISIAGSLPDGVDNKMVDDMIHRHDTYQYAITLSDVSYEFEGQIDAMVRTYTERFVELTLDMCVFGSPKVSIKHG